MKQLFIFGLLFCACSFVLHAQNKKTSSTEGQSIPTFSTTSSGLSYKILKEGIGKELPSPGGYITFWFQIRTDKDSIIENQFDNTTPAVSIETPILFHKPSIEEGLLLLTEGDSAIFLLNADSLFLNTFRQERPAFLKPQSTIKMIVKMGNVYSKRFVDSVRFEEQTLAAKQRAAATDIDTKDSIAIQKYLARKNLKGERTQGGAYVVILSTDPQIKKKLKVGDNVEVAYIGTLLIEGTLFDSSKDGDYFKFTLGAGEVIKGWDEGLQKLKPGDKAILLIPSRMAYGARGAGSNIPPNAPLVFEVEVKK
ncbi:FKBP-type peptidyl-prolyl cis-trans isomerase [Cytophaga aurantiaca]|uniref:FKBP-type peptidyl-prolyl cis-trans isomerase n=1 Tax=Cytophaga aurantiaca TaxID=29530 RepID=UPI00036160C5|nr:FKBP-type peptidyl-prolyl cis-trans isomerase [Cytophaga aurantiaca]